MQINLIWAQARNRVIGKDGTMPWHLPEDLAHLKRTTLGYPVIMGRKTWDSIPPKFQPLPGRTNIVLTRQMDWSKNGAQRASDLREALLFCEQLASKPQAVWIIGGAQIYAQAMPLAQQAVVTEIEADFEGDSFAPQFDAGWHETAREAHVSSGGLHYSFVTRVRG
jgi:dihydrofolate reductase